MEFKNPWLQDPARRRSTLEVPLRVVGEIQRLEAKDGAVQTTASILINKFLHELAKLNYDTGDRYSYQNAVLNARVTLHDNLGKPLIENTESRVAAPVTPTRPKRSRTKQAAS